MRERADDFGRERRQRLALRAVGSWALAARARCSIPLAVASASRWASGRSERCGEVFLRRSVSAVRRTKRRTKKESVSAGVLKKAVA